MAGSIEHWVLWGAEDTVDGAAGNYQPSNLAPYRRKLLVTVVLADAWKNRVQISRLLQKTDDLELVELDPQTMSIDLQV